MSTNKRNDLPDASLSTQFLLTQKQREKVLSLAAAGLPPARIAAAIGLLPALANAFVALADMPGSPISVLIEQGRTDGIAEPQSSLQNMAAEGNIDAIKELRKLQRENRFNELISYMDDDEYTG